MGFGHQGNRSVGADGKKTGMTQRKLAGVTHQKVQTDHHDHVDGHVIGHIDIIIFCKEGKCGQKNDQYNKPESNNTG